MKAATAALVYFGIMFYALHTAFFFGYRPSGPFTSPPGKEIYAALSTISFVLVLLYHTLIVNKLILGAWLMELGLIILNIACVLDISLALVHHRLITDIFNITAILLLVGNFLNGSFLDNRFFSRPVYSIDSFAGSRYHRLIFWAKKA